MTRPLRLFGERFRIDPALVPDVSNGIGRADSIAGVSERVLGPSDLFDLRPGFSFRMHASGASGVGPDSILAGLDYATRFGDAGSLGDGLTLAGDTAADPRLQRTPLAAARADLVLSYTPPNQDDRIVESATVRVSAAAAGTVFGTETLATTLAPLFRDAATFETEARDARAAVEAELAYFRNGGEVRALRDAISSGNEDRIIAAALPVLTHLATTERRLGALQNTLRNADSLLTRLSAVPSTFLASGVARGSVEVDRSVRMRVGEIHGRDGSARLTLGATVGGIAPLSMPNGTLPPIPGMAPVRSLMLSVTAIATTSVSGLADLQSLIGDAASLVNDANALVHQARTSPLRYRDPREAASAQSRIADLETRGTALADRASTVLAGLSGTVRTGARVREAIGPGIALRAVGAEIDGTIGSSFDYRLSVTLRNLIGVLPGVSTDYTIAADEAGDPTFVAGARTAEDVFGEFYPRGVAVDASVRARFPDGSVELRGGVDNTRAGTAAYVGLIGRVHSFYASTGVILPDVSRPDVLPPQISLGLGYDGPRLTIGVSAGADSRIFSGDPTSLRSVSGSLSVGVHF